MMEGLRAIGAATYLSITTPFPGTPLLVNRDDYEIRMETWNWEDFRWSNPTYSTANFTRNDLRRAVFRDAVSTAASVARSEFRDPASAPWTRFAPGTNVTLPPPPPDDNGRDPLGLPVTDRDAARHRVSLPLLTVDR